MKKLMKRLSILYTTIVIAFACLLNNCYGETDLRLRCLSCKSLKDPLCKDGTVNTTEICRGPVRRSSETESIEGSEDDMDTDNDTIWHDENHEPPKDDHRHVVSRAHASHYSSCVTSITRLTNTMEIQGIRRLCVKHTGDKCLTKTGKAHHYTNCYCNSDLCNSISFNALNSKSNGRKGPDNSGVLSFSPSSVLLPMSLVVTVLCIL